jgi:hypothetical protein
MVNYKFSKIFKLYEVDNPNNYYISSTTEPCLCRKLQQLKKQYQKSKANPKSRLPQKVQEILNTGNYQIVLLTNVEANNKDELNSLTINYINQILSGPSSLL